MKITLGHGIKTNSSKRNLGMEEASMHKVRRNRTLGSIAKQLAKQMKIKNGVLTIESVNFTFAKEG